MLVLRVERCWKVSVHKARENKLLDSHPNFFLNSGVGRWILF